MPRYPYIPNPSLPALPGIYCPAEGRPSYDGDTITIALPLLGEVRIRLSGINTPELDEAGGDTARQFVNSRLSSAGEVWCWLELAIDLDGDGRVSLRELLKKATFDRWPGTVYCDGVDLRVELLANDLANRKD